MLQIRRRLCQFFCFIFFCVEEIFTRLEKCCFYAEALSFFIFSFNLFYLTILFCAEAMAIFCLDFCCEKMFYLRGSYGNFFSCALVCCYFSVLYCVFFIYQDCVLSCQNWFICARAMAIFFHFLIY